jgi:hypothetical protein
VSDNRNRLVIERNCLETSERDSKKRWLLSSSLKTNLKTDSQHSSGKYKYEYEFVGDIVVIVKDLRVSYSLFLFILSVDSCECRRSV